MEDIQRLVEQVHNSPPVVVVAVTGAGAQALAWLLAVPGASRTLLEATVPYGQRSMEELLGHEPDQYVSRETAVEMARAAYLRGLRLREDITPVVGLACTASIATDRLKRGEHRCSVAAWCESGAISYDLKLAKGERDRPGEEALVSRLVLHTLGLACGVEPELSLGLKDTERLEMRQTDHYTPIRRLLSRRENEGSEAGTVIVQPDGRTGENEPVHGGVLPGSFSPLHHGHEQLAKLVSEELGAPVTFELSVVNVDKPTLTEEQLRRRLRQFQGRWSVRADSRAQVQAEGGSISRLHFCYWLGYRGEAGRPGLLRWSAGDGAGGPGRDALTRVPIPGCGQGKRRALHDSGRPSVAQGV